MDNIVRIMYSHCIKRSLGKVQMTMILVVSLMSCINDVLDQSLEQAGNNRQELQKVLTYFEDDEDPLKYEAACFLIENMPYHGTFYGKDLEKYINSYDAMGAEPREKRGEKWNELSKQIDIHGLKYANDITKMKADYLIRAINQAVDTWNASEWCKEYDKSVFFDYVLPYRVANERTHISIYERQHSMEFTRSADCGCRK